ncbi:hypothetical protein TNCV_2413731 [Trichonephila clavipes]|nr:hypothetical protein TNCV_2413731 [Trichonephila clavipes]
MTLLDTVITYVFLNRNIANVTRRHSIENSGLQQWNKVAPYSVETILLNNHQNEAIGEDGKRMQSIKFSYGTHILVINARFWHIPYIKSGVHCMIRATEGDIRELKPSRYAGNEAVSWSQSSASAISPSISFHSDLDNMVITVLLEKPTEGNSTAKDIGDHVNDDHFVGSGTPNDLISDSGPLTKNGWPSLV